jgi:NADH:ubiquinone oxidoreductase subunit C
MDKEQLKKVLTEWAPDVIIDESGEWMNAELSPGSWPEVAWKLRNTPALSFDYLFCLTCIDWKTHLTMVYHLTSTHHRLPLVVKAKLDRSAPAISTVSHIWRTAEFHERECHELFGVDFLCHPDLRLLILPDGWEGKYPLRKDFEDPVNMIKL